MAKVNLAKALKMKNSLVAEINRAKAVLIRENSRNDRSTSKVNRDEVLKTILEKTEALVLLKTKISSANIGIYGVLAAAEEAKSFIAYLGTLPTKDGTEVEHTRYSVTPTETTTTYRAFLKQEDIDSRVAALQKQVEDYQDQIDTFNATHFIEA